MPSHNYHRAVDRAPKKRANHYNKRHYNTFDREIDLFANNLERDFERALTRNFGSWDPFGYSSHSLLDPLFYRPKPVQSFYEKKTILHDDDGRTIVKTVKKSPGKPWESYVEEFKNGKSIQQEDKKIEAVEQNKDIEIVEEPIQDQGSVQQQNFEEAVPAAENNDTAVEQNNNQSNLPQSSQDEESTRHNNDNDMLSLFDREFRDLSSTFTRTFNPFFGRRSAFDALDLWDSQPLHFNPERTSYRLKTIINNNGDMTVKTAAKDPGSEWQTSVQHYNRDGSIEGNKNPEAIAEQHKSKRKRSEQVDEGLANSQKVNNTKKAVSH